MAKTIIRLCESCGGNNLKTHQTPYPFKMGDKQINVGRVSVKECMDCHFMEPTQAGKEKIGRCVMSFMSLMG
jgi:YgiT-type zinc finger domain-containing protein